MKLNKMSSDRVDEIIKSLGIGRYGFAKLERPFSFSHYLNWIENGYHGEMEYLKSQLPQKEDPTLLLKQARTAIVFAIDYMPHPFPQKSTPLKTALYAQGQDYHFWLKEKLNLGIQKLKVEFPKEDFVAFTDSGPVMERDLAYRAGLGWVGKNTCLIDEKHGSLFFIGEIFTTMSLIARVDIAPDRCGTCTRCIDVCPTNAISEPRNLVAERCISYLTIERKSVEPSVHNENIGDWYFGCDLCQTVCPWNKKVYSQKLDSSEPNPAEIIDDIRWILSTSNKQITKRFRPTPLNRLSGVQHKRNALALAANLKAKVLLPEIEALFPHQSLGMMAQWAYENISSLSASSH